MADLTTEEIAELRRLRSRRLGFFFTDWQEVLWRDAPALLDMAERCAKAEAELAVMRERMEDYTDPLGRRIEGGNEA